MRYNLIKNFYDSIDFFYYKNICAFLGVGIKFCQKCDLIYFVKRIDKIKNHIILHFINRHMKSFKDIEYIGCEKTRNDIDDQNIWVLWLQGEENMPEIVSLCYKQIKINSNGHKVILLTYNNLNLYLKISSNILNKVGKSISYAAFSDYIRFNLLSLYGGLWIDSTYFIVNPLDKNIFKREFWSIHKPYPTPRDSNYSIISKSKWTGNLMYTSKDCDYIRLCRNLFCNYWNYYNKSFDYFLIDDCIWYIYNSYEKFKELIDSLPITNKYSLSVEKKFNLEWNEKQWNNWINSTQFFKLTYKGKFIKQKNGHLTNYGFLLKKYNKQ